MNQFFKNKLKWDLSHFESAKSRISLSSLQCISINCVYSILFFADVFSCIFIFSSECSYLQRAMQKMISRAVHKMTRSLCPATFQGPCRHSQQYTTLSNSYVLIFGVHGPFQTMPHHNGKQKKTETKSFPIKDFSKRLQKGARNV